MGDSKERDLKVVTDWDHGVAIVLDDFDFLADAGVLEFVPDQSSGKSWRIDHRDINASDKERNAANMVFVAVGDE